MKHIAEDEIEGIGTTAKLCEWIANLDISQIPAEVLERAKYLILDGIACGLVGAHVPWTEEAANAISLFEPAGSCTVIGYDAKYGPIAAAMINGTSIQATELDDYHSIAPLHSNSVILPALFAAAESPKPTPSTPTPTGLDFLLATIAGYETGPRVGKALNGASMLTQGWHSGPIFGAPAAAAATSKLLHLSPSATESAIGIACTQAGGLMSAQYEGMVKRMQHAFAARNGLLATLLARTDYLGILKVFERPYGGFLSCFTHGSPTTPKFHIGQITHALGIVWELDSIRVKLHASVGGSHGHIEVTRSLQRAYPDRFCADALQHIKCIRIGLSAAIHAHDGWIPTTRPLSSTGAQMCSAYINAVQLVDRQVLLPQFTERTLDRDPIWELVYKTTCYHDETFDRPDWYCGARVEVVFEDGESVQGMVNMPKGYEPPVSNEEIKDKFRRVVGEVVDQERMERIEELVLKMEELDDLSGLMEMLGGRVKGVFDE